MEPRTLADVLARWEAGAFGGAGPTDPPRWVEKVRDDLEGVARGAAEHATLGEPIRLSKGRISALLACERRLALTADGPVAGDAVEVGVLVDLAAEHHVLAGRRFTGVPPVRELAAAAGRAGAGSLAEEVVAAGEQRAAALLARWPAFPGGWWARTQERMTVGLADGEVVLSGIADVAVGGPPTPWPALLIEVKSGPLRLEHRDDGLLYALLLTLRDGVPPAAVATVSALGALHLDVVTPDRMRAAAHRVAVAVRVAAALAAGRPPVPHPGRHCGACPVRSSCPAILEAAA